MTAELAETTDRDDWGPARSRTVTWHEPGPSTAKGLTMAGVDYLRAMADGELPAAADRGPHAFRDRLRRSGASGLHV